MATWMRSEWPDGYAHYPECPVKAGSGGTCRCLELDKKHHDEWMRALEPANDLYLDNIEQAAAAYERIPGVWAVMHRTQADLERYPGSWERVQKHRDEIKLTMGTDAYEVFKWCVPDVVLQMVAEIRRSRREMVRKDEVAKLLRDIADRSPESETRRAINEAIAALATNW